MVGSTLGSIVMSSFALEPKTTIRLMSDTSGWIGSIVPLTVTWSCVVDLGDVDRVGAAVGPGHGGHDQDVADDADRPRVPSVRFRVTVAGWLVMFGEALVLVTWYWKVSVPLVFGFAV